MLIYDAETYAFLAANPAATTCYGLTQAELRSKTILDIGPAEDLPRLEAHLAELARQRQVTSGRELQFIDCGTWRHRRKDGRLFFVDLKSAPISFKGRVARILVVNDVTEHKELAEALRASELKYRQIVTSARDAIISADDRGRIVSWNDEAEAMFGWTEAEMLGAPLARIIPERYLAAYRAGVDQFAATGQTPNVGRIVELAGLRRAGREFALELTHAVWADDGRRYFTAIVRDIEGKKRIERDLRASEERLSVAADSARMAAWELDLSTGEAWTSNVRSITGPGEDRSVRSFDEWLALLHPGDREAVRDSVGRAISLGIEQQADFRVVWDDGKTHWFRGMGRTLAPVDGGRSTRFFGMSWEITELKAAESALLAAKDAAEAASRAKSEFLANMSHEIRTPLAVITGFSALLDDPEVHAEERLQFTQTILRNGEQLTRLIDEILDLSKVEAGRLSLEIMSFPLADLLTDIASTLQGKAREKGIELSIVSEGVLPDQVVSDPTRLRQVLLNIIGNAIKFTENGGVYVTVGHTDGMLRFQVQDTGIGISAAGAERLFQPFSQADSSTTRMYGGTGLGLVLARRLACELGGDVFLERSAVGEGSTFVALLSADLATIPGAQRVKGTTPVAALSRNAEPASPPAAIAITGGAPSSGRLAGTEVLVVEDAQDIRTLISLMLEDCGACVELASDGEEGLRKAKARTYDVVLMDLQLPRLDGFAATRRLRAEGYAGPIVALSAFAMQAERARSIESGCTMHLTKPIDKEMLVGALEGLTQGHILH